MSTFDDQERRPDGAPAEPPPDPSQPTEGAMPTEPVAPAVPPAPAAGQWQAPPPPPAPMAPTQSGLPQAPPLQGSPMGQPPAGVPDQGQPVGVPPQGAPQAGWQQPMAPVGKGGKKPGVIGIVLGVVLIVLGPILGVLLGVIGGIAGGALDSFSAPIFGSGETKTVSLSANTDYAIWVDSDTATNGSGSCDVQTPSGDSASFRRPSTQQTISRGSDGSFEAQLVFTSGAAGDYKVLCQTDSGDNASFFVATPLVTKSLGIWVLVGLGVGGILFIVGVVWLIVTIVRRNRWNREHPVFPTATGYYPQQ